VVFSANIGELPLLTEFTFHKTLRDVDFEGVPIRGLDADFYRRPVDGRLLSVGVYRFEGAETHRAWGWVGEEHCAWHAYRDVDSGRFEGPFQGCPGLRVLRSSAGPCGFELGSGGGRRRFLLGARREPGEDDRGGGDRQADREPDALEEM
jgi:hypothetical protein